MLIANISSALFDVHAIALGLSFPPAQWENPRFLFFRHAEKVENRPRAVRQQSATVPSVGLIE